MGRLRRLTCPPGALVISPLFLDGVLTIGLWGLFEVPLVVLCSSRTPQGPLWVIWAIGCGGFMPLEPPSVLLQGFDPFCLGTLFARFGLWIATNMATAAPSTPRSSLGPQGVQGGSGVQPNPCLAPPEHMKSPYPPGGCQMATGCFSFLLPGAVWPWLGSGPSGFGEP